MNASPGFFYPHLQWPPPMTATRRQMLLKNDKLNNIFAIKEKMLHFWDEKSSTSSQLLEKLVFWQKEIYENKIQELQKFAKYILWLNLNKSFAN